MPIRYGTFREALIAAKALEKAFEMLDQTISAAGYLPMGGQIIDATLVAAPKQRNTDGEKAAVKAGEIPEEWKDQPASLYARRIVMPAGR